MGRGHLMQPAPMLHNPFSKEISPNIQPKPPLVQLEAIFPHLTTWCLGEEPNPYLTTTSFKVIVQYNKASQEPPFLQAKQPQLPQEPLIRLFSRPSTSFIALLWTCSSTSVLFFMAFHEQTAFGYKPQNSILG